MHAGTTGLRTHPLGGKEANLPPVSTTGWVIVCLASLSAIAGAVVLALGGGIATVVAGSVLLGLAAIALVALVFLVVGEGEDRDRTRHPRG